MSLFTSTYVSNATKRRARLVNNVNQFTPYAPEYMEYVPYTPSYPEHFETYEEPPNYVRDFDPTVFDKTLAVRVNNDPHNEWSNTHFQICHTLYEILMHHILLVKREAWKKPGDGSFTWQIRPQPQYGAMEWLKNLLSNVFGYAIWNHFILVEGDEMFHHNTETGVANNWWHRDGDADPTVVTGLLCLADVPQNSTVYCADSNFWECDKDFEDETYIEEGYVEDCNNKMIYAPKIAFGDLIMHTCDVCHKVPDEFDNDQRKLFAFTLMSKNNAIEQTPINILKYLMTMSIKQGLDAHELELSNKFPTYFRPSLNDFTDVTSRFM